mmetsp:Transcript_39913/g.100567  ORF Transcript_39913/g.100567 Transcript_39913/m.100567 type:complete len:345 (+) Transcript_39913:26-1060(+)
MELWVAPLICLLVFLAYHVYLIGEVYLRPSWSVFGVNMKFRERWVAKVIQVKAQEILGVQTLRNISMSATVLASSTLVVSLPFIDAFLTERDPACVGVDDEEYDESRIKIIVMCVVYLSAFFNFVIVVRIVTHASFLVGSQVFPDEEEAIPHLSVVVPSKNSSKAVRMHVLGGAHQDREQHATTDRDDTDGESTEEGTDPLRLELDHADDDASSVHSGVSGGRRRSSTVSRPRIRRQRYKRAPERMIASVLRLLNRQHVHFSLGMRSLYMTLPCAFWFISDWWFIGSTVLVVALLAVNDHMHGIPGLLSVLLGLCCRTRPLSTSSAATTLPSLEESAANSVLSP